MNGRVLVAGIGNVFMGDDGFGVAVAERLSRRRLPDGVSVMDAGIRGFDLTMALLGGYDAAILVDATSRGGAPGTLYVIDPEPSDEVPDIDAVFLDAHSLDPARILAFLQASGKDMSLLRVVGCEPETLGSDVDPQIGLSATVSAAIGPAVSLIESILMDLGADEAEAEEEPPQKQKRRRRA